MKKTIHHDTIFKFVDFSFDLEFCKVVYDGKRLYIRDINCLFKKQCKVNLDLDKYIRRCLYSVSEITDAELIFKLARRVTKYEQRGFTILQ